MALRHIWKASLLTALVLFSPTATADDSSNAEDGGENGSNGEEGPCDIVVISIIPPEVDPHPECIPDIVP